MSESAFLAGLSLDVLVVDVLLGVSAIVVHAWLVTRKPALLGLIMPALVAIAAAVVSALGQPHAAFLLIVVLVEAALIALCVVGEAARRAGVDASVSAQRAAETPQPLESNTRAGVAARAAREAERAASANPHHVPGLIFPSAQASAASGPAPARHPDEVRGMFVPPPLIVPELEGDVPATPVREVPAALPPGAASAPLPALVSAVADAVPVPLAEPAEPAHAAPVVSVGPVSLAVPLVALEPAARAERHDGGEPESEAPRSARSHANHSVIGISREAVGRNEAPDPIADAIHHEFTRRRSR